MPKNAVTDPITDQEMAFAHLVMSGTMNDCAAAKAAGLNPDSAAYTKSKPRVRDYMIEHRNAVREKLVALEVEGLRKLNLGRDQVLTRLWELAYLSHEVTRGTIAGQIKALTMIVAIEGLIPGRPSASQTQAAASPVQAEIRAAEWLHKQPHAEEQGDPVVPPEAQPATQPAPKPEPSPKPSNGTLSLNPDRNPLSVANAPIYPGSLIRVPAATAYTFDTALDTALSLKLPFSPRKGPLAPGR
jgi:hypothetical protein